MSDSWLDKLIKKRALVIGEPPLRKISHKEKKVSNLIIAEQITFIVHAPHTDNENQVKIIQSYVRDILKQTESYLRGRLKSLDAGLTLMSDVIWDK